MRQHHTKLIFIEEGFRMKLFKKVLAAALAGVLALSVLTGCNNSNSVATVKMLDALNDWAKSMVWILPSKRAIKNCRNR